jgi:hypothetical protein
MHVHMRQKSVCPMRFLQVCCMLKLWCIDDGCNSYDPREDKWSVLAEMSTARALAGCTVFKNKIYVIGKLKFVFINSFAVLMSCWRREL